MDNNHSRSAKLRLTIAIFLGTLSLAVLSWLFTSGTLSSLNEHRATITNLTIGLFATLAAILWLRRMRLTSAKADPVSFFYRLCKAVSLVILAVLVLSWGYDGLISPMWGLVGIFSAAAFLVAAYVLLLYRTFWRTRRVARHSGNVIWSEGG